MIDILIMDHDWDVMEAMSVVLYVDKFKVEAVNSRNMSIKEMHAAIVRLNPRIIIYDLGAPPIAPAFERFQELVSMYGVTDRAFIITTTNPHFFRAEPRCRIGMLLPRPVGLFELEKAIHFFIKDYPCRE